MNLRDIFKDEKTKVFIVTENDYDNELNWVIEPTNYELIPNDENYYIIKAYEVLQNKTTDCFLGIIIPEQVIEIVIKQNAKGEAYVEGYYQQPNSIIPAIASDFFGYYEKYYAKENPQIGIDVLKNGLKLATNKSTVAEELAYLLMDEDRNIEAIEALKICEGNGPISAYTFWHIANLYKKIGRLDKHDEYMQKYKAYSKKA